MRHPKEHPKTKAGPYVFMISFRVFSFQFFSSNAHLHSIQSNP